MKSKLFFISLLLLVSNAFAQVAINTDGSAANPSAILDVKSTTAGILIPRMTAAQRDAFSTLSQGLMVYVIDDNTFYYYDGSHWDRVGNGASYWHAVNGTVYTDSLVGIGTTIPNAPLDVSNTSRATTLRVGLYNNDNDDHFGIYNRLLTSGTGFQFGIYNKLDINSTGTNSIFGIENRLSDMGSGDKNVTVESNIIFGEGGGVQTGIIQQISNNGNGYHYGLKNEMRGTGWGDKYGVYNYTSSGSDGVQYGVYSSFNSTSSYSKYGVYNYTSSGTGGVQYGVYSDLNGSGANAKYGVFNSIPYSAGGIHYGTYNDVQGSSNYAGYFLGRLYASDKAGFGTANPAASLEISNSTNDTTLKIVTTNNNSNEHYGLFNSLTSSGTNKQYGIYNSLSLSGSGTGSVRGIFNTISDNGTGSRTIKLERAYIGGSGDGTQWGIDLAISNTGNGTHQGINVTLDGTGTGHKTGIGISIPTTAGGTHYGVWSEAEGSSNYAGYFLGRLYANDKVGFGTTSPNASLDISNSSNDTTLMVSSTNSNNDRHFGIVNYTSNSGTGEQYGIYNQLYVSGTTTNSVYASENYVEDFSTSNKSIYTVNNVILGSSSGYQYGIYQQLSSSGNGKHYGLYNDVEGTGSGNKYGVYNYIPSSASGTHYGTYNDVQGSSNYAGYYNGRMYVSDKVGFGTTNPHELLEVAGSSGAQGRMVVSDGGGSNRYGLLLVSPNSTTNGRIETYLYGAEQGQTLEVNTVGNGDAMFGGDIYPENDNSKVLGTASKAWKNVYAYHYYTMTLASFAGRNVSTELLRFPPKTAGKAADGSEKLDISSLPAVLTDENGVLLNKMTTFNYQANYEQEVELKALKEDIALQKQEINDLKKMVEEQKVMINLLLGQQKK